MPSNDNHDAHDYGERIRERLPRRLQELRERCGLSKYGLARESGVSREYLGKIERGKANPTLPVTAQISHGLGMTREQFTGELEDGNHALVPERRKKCLGKPNTRLRRVTSTKRCYRRSCVLPAFDQVCLVVVGNPWSRAGSG
jgi:DNA-binding XRE family transcriptional regulator